MTAMNVMIPDDIRKQAEKVARNERLSLDEFMTLALVQRLSLSVPDPYLEERAKRGSVKRLREILSQAPDVPPEENDRL